MENSRCVVLRQPLIMLTGDFKKALLLSQLLYWSERVRNAMELIEEERARFQCGEKQSPDVASLQYGWIYKKAEELAEEVMIGMGAKAVRDHLKYMVSKGWLFERRNPKDRMDRTLQYRVNLVRIHHDLAQLGYVLKEGLFHGQP